MSQRHVDNALNRTVVLVLPALLSVLLSGCSFSLLPPLKLSPDRGDVGFVERAAEFDSQNPHAWFMIGRELLESGEFSEARAAFQKALKQDGNFAEARLGIGKSYIAERDWTAAAKVFGEAVSANPGSAAAQEGLAEAYFGAGNISGAEAAAGKALEINDRSFMGHLILGNVRYLQRRFEEALHHWRAADKEGKLPLDVMPVYMDLWHYVEKYGE